MKNFANIPQVRYNRSKFDLSHGVKTSMSVGKLYPLKVLEVLPGDSFKSVMTAVVRCTSSFLKPIIDNLYMDVHHFFVPLRLLYDKSEGVFGNPNPSAYTDNDLEEFPKFDFNTTISPGTVGDYLGLPVYIDGTRRYCKKGISIMPFRAFAKIYNDWFRNENSTDEMFIHTGEYSSSEVPNNNPWSASNYTGQLPNVGKKKDYFTACLPGTQKGAAIPLPLGSIAPVYAMADRSIDVYSKYNAGSLRFVKAGEPFTETTSGNLAITFDDFSPASDGKHAYSSLDTNATVRPSDFAVSPSNLVTDLSLATAADISTLRTAFQLQKMLEKDARYGSRYNEFLLGHFGVTSPDARLQFSEYLGGGRIPISIQQVSQTSAPTEDSPLGAYGANSQSVGRSRYSKGFVEHGFVISVGCIRQMHTYQQGIPKLFFRRKRDDFYDPLLANISEQPVWKSQLFGYETDPDHSTDIATTPFAYNEAWAEYRFEPSIITGQLRSGVTNSLDIWHLADFYESAPTYGQSFTEENSANIDRVLTVETSTLDNFLVDMWFDVKAIRVMPVYSVPGLVDHH